MRVQDQKTLLTKAINKYLRTSYTVLKLGCSFIAADKTTTEYTVILTPGSPILIAHFETSLLGKYRDRISVSRFSDFVVRNNGFEQLYSKFITQENTDDQPANS
jgi:hypothetical protein